MWNIFIQMLIPGFSHRLYPTGPEITIQQMSQKILMHSHIFPLELLTSDLTAFIFAALVCSSANSQSVLKTESNHMASLLQILHWWNSIKMLNWKTQHEINFSTQPPPHTHTYNPIIYNTLRPWVTSSVYKFDIMRSSI